MPRYIHELPEWPRFHWQQDELASSLAELRHRQGRLQGRMEGFGFVLQKSAELETLTLDVVKSSEIEGEVLDATHVRSSIARRLGVDNSRSAPNRHIDAIVKCALDATQHFDQPLTTERVFEWQAALFPQSQLPQSQQSNPNGAHTIATGAWRNDANGPMQVVSGAMGVEKVHFEAPAAACLDQEMSRFFAAANNTTDRMDPVLKAGLLHLWFVTIHPFDDGNGRVARAISDWQLARAENSAQRFYSMSAQIRQERNTYYDTLERTQKGTLDITRWMLWFLDCLGRALDRTDITLAGVLRSARFWEQHAHIAVNDRQRDMLNKLLDGFDGHLTTTKWASMEKCSHDTALRDIQNLVELRLLTKSSGGGRSTAYGLTSDL